MKISLFFKVATAALLLSGCAAQSPRSDLSLILLGGTVYSGANTPGVVADVWIKDDRIVNVGQLGSAPAERVLDVTGLAVTPGFIDLHSHAIRSTEAGSGIFRWPDAENLLRQGVSTVIGGPDGWSPLPLEESFNRLEANPAAVNFGAFVGHGAVRQQVVGLQDRPPTEVELAEMKQVVDEAMQQGAFGLSSGLVYTPGQFADTQELIALSKIAANHGGIYISHMRNENLEVLDSVDELIRIAGQANIAAQITHVKLMGTAMQGRAPELLQKVDQANDRGLDISMDQYPYAAGRTSLMVQFPRWSVDGGSKALNERLDDPALRARIHEELVYQLKHVRGRNDPANVQISQCRWNPDLDGLSLSRILENRGQEKNLSNAADLVIELQQAGGCQAIYHSMHPEDVATLMSHPRTMIASDGGVEVPGNGHPHPRNYGTNARVLAHYVRDQSLLPLHTAIHKMTRMPADRIGLSDRGRIEAGAIADIVILDPERVQDHSTFERPHQYSDGVIHMLIAGEAVLLNEQMTGARPGRALRSTDREIEHE